MRRYFGLPWRIPNINVLCVWKEKDALSWLICSSNPFYIRDSIVAFRTKWKIHQTLKSNHLFNHIHLICNVHIQFIIKFYPKTNFPFARSAFYVSNAVCHAIHNIKTKIVFYFHFIGNALTFWHCWSSMFRFQMDAGCGNFSRILLCNKSNFISIFRFLCALHRSQDK